MARLGQVDAISWPVDRTRVRHHRRAPGGLLRREAGEAKRGIETKRFPFDVKQKTSGERPG